MIGHLGRNAFEEMASRLGAWCAHDEVLRWSTLSTTCPKYGLYLGKHATPGRLHQRLRGLDFPVRGE